MLNFRRWRWRKSEKVENYWSAVFRTIVGVLCGLGISITGTRRIRLRISGFFLSVSSIMSPHVIDGGTSVGGPRFARVSSTVSTRTSCKIYARPPPPSSYEKSENKSSNKTNFFLNLKFLHLCNAHVSKNR